MGVGGVLRDRNAAVYLGAVVVSSFGSGALTLAAGVWVMTLTGDSSLAALVVVLLWAPTVAGPFIGAVIDRIGRYRAVLVGTMAGTGVLVLSLGAVTSAGWLWLLYTVMLIDGIAYVAIFAAETALLPQVVAPALLGDVNGLRMSAAEGTKLAAPLVGAALFAAWGGAAVAVLDAASFGIAALLCLLMKPVEAAPVRRERVRVRDGLRYLVERVHLRRVVVSAAVALVLAGFAGTMTFALVDEGLGLAPTFVGVLVAVQGVGSVLSGIFSGAVLRRLSPLGFAAVGLTLFSVGILLRMTTVVPLVLIGTAIAGLGLPAPLVAATTTMQIDSPPELLARITGSVQLVMYAPNALAQALGVVVVGFVDFRISLGVVGVVGLAAAGWATWTVLVRREDRSRARVAGA
ncbi:MFS transporter [Actinokineospora baliensis]|uniref:MFS transporter n=1 Tax=Actinokineospora baliensis TaxID=547056 RepID=UPI0023BA6332|nr:MFS transporter [Actinokineospora baliensis]